MPRDVIITSPEPLSLEHIVSAAAAVDPELGVRTIAHQGAAQLVAPGGTVVLTLSVPRLVQDPREADRLVPGAGADGACWWTEAIVPWGPAGAVGVAIARACAGAVGGKCTVGGPG